VLLPQEQLAKAITVITRERRTGKLTINFSQGNPAGEVRWTERTTDAQQALAVD